MLWKKRGQFFGYMLNQVEEEFSGYMLNQRQEEKHLDSDKTKATAILWTYTLPILMYDSSQRNGPISSHGLH